MRKPPSELDELRNRNAHRSNHGGRIGCISLYRAMYQYIWNSVVSPNRLSHLNCHELCILVYLLHQEWFWFRNLGFLLKNLPRIWRRNFEISLPHCSCIWWKVQRLLAWRPFQMDFTRRILWLLARSFPCDSNGRPPTEAITWDLLNVGYRHNNHMGIVYD